MWGVAKRFLFAGGPISGRRVGEMADIGAALGD